MIFLAAVIISLLTAGGGFTVTPYSTVGQTNNTPLVQIKEASVSPVKPVVTNPQDTVILRQLDAELRAYKAIQRSA